MPDLSITDTEHYRIAYENFPRGAIRLHKLRKEKSLSQRQLGELVDLPNTKISRMENGRISIDKASAESFADIFGVDPDDFY